MEYPMIPITLRSTLIIYIIIIHIFFWFSFFIHLHINARGLFNAKAIFSEKKSCGIICSMAREIKMFILFPKGMSPKMNALAWPEFELAYYDVAIQLADHYVTGTPSSKFFMATTLTQDAWNFETW